MRIGIISDTHDSLPMIARAVEVLRPYGIEHLIHAGDFVAPFAVKALAAFGAPVTAVYGNNDGEKRGIEAAFGTFGSVSEKTARVELAGRRIIVMHEPMLLDALAGSGLCDVCVYGHTHRPEVRTEGTTLIINPGEACGYVEGHATVVVLNLETLQPELLGLDA